MSQEANQRHQPKKLLTGRPEARPTPVTTASTDLPPQPNPNIVLVPGMVNGHSVSGILCDDGSHVTICSPTLAHRLRKFDDIRPTSVIPNTADGTAMNIIGEFNITVQIGRPLAEQIRPIRNIDCPGFRKAATDPYATTPRPESTHDWPTNIDPDNGPCYDPMAMAVDIMDGIDPSDIIVTVGSHSSAGSQPPGDRQWMGAPFDKCDFEVGRASVPAATLVRTEVNVCESGGLSAQRSHSLVNGLIDSDIMMTTTTISDSTNQRMETSNPDLGFQPAIITRCLVCPDLPFELLIGMDCMHRMAGFMINPSDGVVHLATGYALHFQQAPQDN